MRERHVAWKPLVAVAVAAGLAIGIVQLPNRCAIAADPAASAGQKVAVNIGAAPSSAQPVETKKPKRPPLDEGIVRREKPLYPRVLFVTTKSDPRCDTELARLQKPGGDFESMRSVGWTIGETADKNIQIVDRDLIPELAKQLNIREYPAVACIDKGKVVRSFKSGCTTPLDAWTFGWLAKGVDERPTAPVLDAAKVESTGHWPLRGNHWSVSGDWNPTREAVIAHLRGPNHAAEIQAGWRLEDWSYEELRSLHDDLHERDPSYNPYATQSSGPSPYYKSKGER